MKHFIFSTLCSLLSILCLTACDPEQFPDEVGITDMIFYRHDATIMVGDTCYLQLYFEPEDITTPNAYWWVARGNVAMVGSEQGYVKGLQPGRDTVFVRTVDGQFDDKCAIEVIPSWRTFGNDDYEYDMMVYADVEIDGEHNNPDILTAAYIGSSVRGTGRVVTSHGVTCTAFRVYNNWSDYGTVSFHFYDPKTFTAGTFETTLEYDGERHGTPSNPIKLSFTRED